MFRQRLVAIRYSQEHRVLGVLHLAEDPVAVQLQLAPVGVRERRERLMVACTGTDQSAVVHERSLALRLTTTATPPMLEIRRRVSPPGWVKTRDRQKEAQMLHPALTRAIATAHIEDLHRTAAPRHAIRLARRVAHEPRAAATPI